MHVEEVMKQSIYGYSPEPTVFLKIYFDSFYSFRNAKEFLSKNIFNNGEQIRFKFFESNFPIVLRFMNDLEITGMSYIKVKEVVEEGMLHDGTKEYRANVNNLEPLPLSGEYFHLLPLKILSFDIECCGNSNSFPEAKRDPVIQIGNTIQRFGKEEQTRTIFCLKETAPISGADVRWFDDEREMLMAWSEFITKENPDILTGYNIKGYDFPYLNERAEALQIKEFGRIGRSDALFRVVNKQQSSNNFGAFDTKEVYIDGRIVLDMLHIVRREHKLRSYSLNAVSLHFLNEQKEDVPYSSMNSLQNGDAETRRRIASYCLRDTHLPLRLLDKLNVFVNYTELSRVTHVPFEFFSTRGAAIKVLSQIYYESKHSGFVVPDLDLMREETSYEGAFVLDPVKGFYSAPIAVLDFCSLYPSIIISKNLCYSTLMTRKQFDELGGRETPTGDYFCKASLKEGLLPRLLRNLLAARKEARAALKKEKDPWMRRALDARQLALKLCANSLYGFTGSPAGQLPCIEISQSTTGFGRQMISETKELIECNFNRKNGFAFDASIVYGDTDSVMVNFVHGPDGSADPGSSLEEAFRIGPQIAQLVSRNFEEPISLAFEKVYCPFLLMNKKRYAGLIYEEPSRPKKVDMKGIEAVRRDNCELVKNVVQKCLDKILYEKDIEGAIHHVKETVRKLYLEQIDMSELVISKTFTKETYAAKQTHATLVKKLRDRGQEVGIGERIPYVIVKGDKKMLTHEKSEDPLYVIEKGLQIDREYYIEQQLSKPLYRLFEPIMEDVSILFHGEHTRKAEQSGTYNGPLNAFVKSVEECVGCGKRGCIICTSCRPEFGQHYTKAAEKFNEKAKEFNECWVECQQCQGSVINEVLCVNRICPIWYKRMKIKKEIGPLHSRLQRLRELSW